MERKKILVIGSLNMDMDILMERMPECGETVMGKSIVYIPGGKGANQACAAGKMNGNVAMLGCVGKDLFGKEQRESLARAGVDISRIKTDQNNVTGMAIIYINDAGENHIVVVPGANASCSREYLDDNLDILQEADYVVFQMEIPHDTIYYGIRKAKELGKTVILNPAPVPENIPDEIWEKIDFLTPNEKELSRLAGTDVEQYEEGAEKILSKGVGNVIVTLGDKGVFWVNKKERILIPAKKVEVVDTTAAGDCFHGAFLVGLSEQMEVEQAIQMANLAAALSVTKKGAQSSLPTRKEVEEFMGK